MEEQMIDKQSTEEQPVETQENAPVSVSSVSKAISQVSISDVEFSLDKTKSYEAQAEDVVGALATAQAVNNANTVKDITDKKAEELKVKASQKLKDAQTKDIDAETSRQEAERKKNEAVLSTFGVRKHLPNWLLKIMVFIFAPWYIMFSFIIGLPCGVIKILIDNVDNILVRYETAESKEKPKIKVTVWIISTLLILAGITLTILKIFDKI